VHETTADRLERILARLRERGGRVTTARRAVLGALLASSDHVSAEQLSEIVQSDHPDIHLSTVYRTLEAFEELGVVTHVHLGHGRAIYHLTDQIHHHAVCERCRTVIHLPDGLFSGLQRRLADDFGFELDAHHFALVGHCADCVRSAGGTHDGSGAG
jgi:Fur family transcriptional regulator, ferric uptake regulator